MKGIVTLTNFDTNNNRYTKNLPNVNPNYLPTYDTTVAESDVAKIKTACESLMSLSQDTLTNLNLSVEIDITSVEIQEG